MEGSSKQLEKKRKIKKKPRKQCFSVPKKNILKKRKEREKKGKDLLT